MTDRVAPLALAVAGVLGTCCGTAAGQVTAWTGLPEPVVATLVEYLRDTLPEVTVTIERRAMGVLLDQVRRGAPPGADMCVGIDAEILERWRAALVRPGALAVDRSMFYRSPDGEYVVPWVAPWVVAFDERLIDPREAPRTAEDLMHARWTDRLGLCAPPAAPSFWVQWITARLLEGFSQDHVFAWLATVDARVSAYFDSVDDAAAALVRGDDIAVALLSLPVVRAARDRGEPVSFVALEPAVPSTGLGLALCTDSEEVRRVYDALLEPELGRVLALRHGVLPGPADDLLAATWLPPWLAAIAERTLPWRPEPVLGERWFARWRAEVEGRGRRSEDLDFALDLVFGALFVVFLFIVYRKMRATDA